MIEIDEEIRERKIKSAFAAFPMCPDCRCKKLILIDQDVFCTLCGWDSIEASVSCGRSIFPDGAA